MEVRVESAAGLSRRLHVTIPADRVEREVGERLKRIAGRVRVPGFRPGKAPLKVIRQQYGNDARMDVISELVRQTYPEAVEQAKVQPAGAPNFEVTAEKAGEPLAYVASFDVFPEIQLAAFDALAVSRPVVEVSEADVARLVDNLRKAKRSVAKVERAAQVGDIVVVDFDGKLDGERFQGGKGENIEIEVGTGQFLPDLENALVAHEAGETFDAEVKFPADYRNETLAGKPTIFTVTIKEVREQTLPEVDAEFLKLHGVDEAAGAAGLDAKCRGALEGERDKAVRAKLKRELMDQLLAANPIDVPSGQVSEEINRLREDTAQRMGAGRNLKMKPEQLQAMLPAEMFEAAAKRRVALGLLIGEVIKKKAIELDNARVDRQLDEIAVDYEQPEQVHTYYKSNPQLMQSLRMVALEEQVVDALLADAKVTDEPMPLEELLKSQNATPTV
jgi:trigger factor